MDLTSVLIIVIPTVSCIIVTGVILNKSLKQYLKDDYAEDTSHKKQYYCAECEFFCKVTDAYDVTLLSHFGCELDPHHIYSFSEKRKRDIAPIKKACNRFIINHKHPDVEKEI